MRLRQFWMMAAMGSSAVLSGVARAQSAVSPTGSSMKAAADKDVKATEAKTEEKGTEMKDRALGAMDKEELKTLNELHHGNQMEIQMGQLALEEASDTKVKDFGSQMVKDHGKMDKDVMDFAKDHKLTVAEPAAKKGMAKMDKLRELKGAAFDKSYMSEMLKDHNEDIAKVSAARAKTVDKDMQKLLDGALSTMKEHRKMVQDWMKKAPAHARTMHME